jgi:hypothetical protein
MLRCPSRTDRLRPERSLPKIGRWRDALDQLLAQNETKSSRERLTLIRLFEELRGRGYDVFQAGQADQGDLPGVGRIPQGRQESDPVGGDRVSLPAGRSATRWCSKESSVRGKRFSWSRIMAS